MFKVTVYSLVLISLTAATAKPLVQCDVPVEVKFIVTPQQLQPGFKEASMPGQKHWSAYGCTMNIAAGNADSNPQGRQLSSSNSFDDENVTTTNETEIATTTAATVVYDTTSTTVSNTNNTNSTTVEAEGEVGGACSWNMWTTGVFSLGVSLSLPVAAAAPTDFMAPHQPRKVVEQIDVVEVLMPCSALRDPLSDLDGDRALDCKMTEEQNAVAEPVPEVEGTWHIQSAQSVSLAVSFENKFPQDSITMGGGAWCMDSSEMALGEAAALTNVLRFTHDGKPCGAKQACEASMWSFDLAYPQSSCTPEVAGWVKPCTAKLLADSTLVLARGAPEELVMQTGKNAGRPPLMTSVIHATDVIPFANGLAAATQSSFEVLVLNKHRVLDAFQKDVDDFSDLKDVSSLASVMMNAGIPPARQLESSSNNTDDENETTITTTEATVTTTVAAVVYNTTTTAANASSNITTTNMTTTTEDVGEGEVGRAQSWGMWTIGFLCLCLRLLMQ
jgi:hypothetical protein